MTFNFASEAPPLPRAASALIRPTKTTQNTHAGGGQIKRRNRGPGVAAGTRFLNICSVSLRTENNPPPRPAPQDRETNNEQKEGGRKEMDAAARRIPQEPDPAVAAANNTLSEYGFASPCVQLKPRQRRHRTYSSVRG